MENSLIVLRALIQMESSVIQLERSLIELESSSFQLVRSLIEEISY